MQIVKKPLKAYILIDETVPVGHAVNCAAHAALGMYLEHGGDPVVQEWAFNSFRKVSCKVTREQFERAKQYSGHTLITESALGYKECALGFAPRYEWPEFFKGLKLYSEIPLDSGVS